MLHGQQQEIVQSTIVHQFNKVIRNHQIWWLPRSHIICSLKQCLPYSSSSLRYPWSTKTHSPENKEITRGSTKNLIQIISVHGNLKFYFVKQIHPKTENKRTKRRHFSSHKQCSQLFIILFSLLIKHFFAMMTEDKWKWWHLSHNFAMFKVDVTIFWNFHQVYKINFFLNSGNLSELPTLSSPSPSPSATFRACVLPNGDSVSKEPAYSSGDPSLIPGSGRSPEEENGNPL